MFLRKENLSYSTVIRYLVLDNCIHDKENVQKKDSKQIIKETLPKPQTVVKKKKKDNDFSSFNI